MQDEIILNKILKRVESHVVLTHESLMKGKNLQGVIFLMQAFYSY